jgi:hypothetical protein
MRHPAGSAARAGSVEDRPSSEDRTIEREKGRNRGEPGGKRERLPGSSLPPLSEALTMRAIIINSKDRTITETDIDGSLKTLQQKVP